ncbi:inactive serine/threonine-protein kinase TEX14-like [Callorhinchus milii]|uniref:inactive serine/threonine-protein kinase TEX14-like n=1 Tax=Callorhinchus milii TaxID=7868 RepID=UPI001C3F7345|nr:inactive serine/threonine-protein kinase TEX14-like [Callorhinchus milii]
MCNLMWDGQLVTIRQVKEDTDPAAGDILFTEHEHVSHLRHAHLLLLLGVSLSESLENVRLVYERVHLGSLYTVLHTRRWEPHPLRTDTIPQLLLQVCDAVIYLHSRGYIHRSLTSHAVQLVSPTVAKLSNLEYLQERAEDGRWSGGPGLPIPHQLYNWLPPEVIRNQRATPSSDLYSFCTVLQEALTGRET